jgi:hypothetical protein
MAGKINPVSIDLVELRYAQEVKLTITKKAVMDPKDDWTSSRIFREEESSATPENFQ